MRKLLLLMGLSFTLMAQTSTPTLKLSLPPIHSVNWGDAVNNNFLMLDGFLSGSRALPASFWSTNLATSIKYGSLLLNPGATNTTAENASNRNVLGGYAGLDANGKVLTTNLPFTYSGSTLKLATTNGSLVSGHCVSIDSSFNFIDAGSACGSGSGGGLVVSGTQVARLIPVATSGSVTTWGQLSVDDLLPAFTVSLSGAQQVEIGATITNPAFTASYSSTPSSATLTNTAGINSPLTLTSPFTSATVTGSFVRTTETVVTFTLSAVGTTTRTSTQNLSWSPRTFAGIGTASATGATASGSNAVLAGATGTLGSVGLGDTYTGQSFTLTPNAQYMYLLLTGSGHTFSVNTFATTFSATTFTFTNQNGSTVTMTLYMSPAAVGDGSTPYVVQVLG